MVEAASPDADYKTSRTIVHEIMDSKPPPSDKTFNCVFQDVSTATGAGFETTARVLRLAFFHGFSSAELLQRLLAELTSAGVLRDHPLDVKTLDQLPYLTAILTGGLRLSPAIATRMARVAQRLTFSTTSGACPSA
jgi:cytochrome P450